MLVILSIYLLFYRKSQVFFSATPLCDVYTTPGSPHVMSWVLCERLVISWNSNSRFSLKSVQLALLHRGTFWLMESWCFIFWPGCLWKPPDNRGLRFQELLQLCRFLMDLMFCVLWPFVLVRCRLGCSHVVSRSDRFWECLISILGSWNCRQWWWDSHLVVCLRKNLFCLGYFHHFHEVDSGMQCLGICSL